jgi:hypothetical protein
LNESKCACPLFSFNKWAFWIYGFSSSSNVPEVKVKSQIYVAATARRLPLTMALRAPPLHQATG